MLKRSCFSSLYLDHLFTEEMKRTRESRTEWSAEIQLNSRDNCDQLLKAPRADGVGNRYKFLEANRKIIAKRKDKRIVAKPEPTSSQLLDTVLSSDLSCRTLKDETSCLKRGFEVDTNPMGFIKAEEKLRMLFNAQKDLSRVEKDDYVRSLFKQAIRRKEFRKGKQRFTLEYLIQNPLDQSDGFDFACCRECFCKAHFITKYHFQRCGEAFKEAQSEFLLSSSECFKLVTGFLIL
jgi:hypothetical protein